MPASKNPDGTITVSGIFETTGTPPLAIQKQEAEALAGQAVALISAVPSNHRGDQYTHTSQWRLA